MKYRRFACSGGGCLVQELDVGVELLFEGLDPLGAALLRHGAQPLALLAPALLQSLALLGRFLRHQLGAGKSRVATLAEALQSVPL